MNYCMLIMFGCTFLTAVSQLLLKQSANLPHKSFLYEYLNWRVILAYFIFVLVLLLNTYAFTRVPLKYGSIIDGFTYVFVLLLSVCLLKEKVTKPKLIGNLIIIAGVIIYAL
ncbi:MAG: EamA family transporter [Lachnospiraceae bacterium]|nr:EamA family transporter [Lachnospiraceae bacterium]